MLSTASSVSVTRSEAMRWLLALSGTRRDSSGRTVFLRVGSTGGGVGGGDHLAGLHGDLYEEIVDVLEVRFCHFWVYNVWYWVLVNFVLWY